MYAGFRKKKMEQSHLEDLAYAEPNIPAVLHESYEPSSKLLVYPLIAPVILPYVAPYITPFKEFRL